MKDLLMNIKQVRSEMRFYVARKVPNFSDSAKEELFQEFEQKIKGYGPKLRIVESDSLRRQKLLSELTKLSNDLKRFKFQKDQSDRNSKRDMTKIPILNPLNELCKKLSLRPTTNH